MSDQKVVTRFAPSPTGFMHVGGVRTALFSWLWARKNNGTFILRIEDTDKEREVAGSIDHIIASLKWLGISWNEGPEVGGPHGPYIQSERLDLYRQYAQKLIDQGFAYPDPYTEEDITTFRKQAEEAKLPFLFRNHRPETFGVWDGTKPLRLKVPEIKKYEWDDMVFGHLSAGEEALDDFILMKTDGYPTYNFAHIVDDIEMGVTHVMRGQEFISSTPKFLSLYEALGMTPPIYAHLPAILAEGGKKKLGKRDGAKDILDYEKEGYLPDAMMNFLAFLGWNPGDDREIFTPEELIQAFDISRIGNSGAQLNEEKLDWINREHIKKVPLETQIAWVTKFLPERITTLPGFNETAIPKITPIILDHIIKWSDINTLAEAGDLDYYFTNPVYDASKLVWKTETKENTLTHLMKALELLQVVSDTDFTHETVKAAVWGYAEIVGRGNILWPLRFALSGKEKSPDPFVLAGVLGKTTTLARIQNAIALLK
jgi:glutamyl-tRNA synthetase